MQQQKREIISSLETIQELLNIQLFKYKVFLFFFKGFNILIY